MGATESASYALYASEAWIIADSTYAPGTQTPGKCQGEKDIRRVKRAPGSWM